MTFLSKLRQLFSCPDAPQDHWLVAQTPTFLPGRDASDYDPKNKKHPIANFQLDAAKRSMRSVRAAATRRQRKANNG